jgi:hypothetical protein
MKHKKPNKTKICQHPLFLASHVLETGAAGLGVPNVETAARKRYPEIHHDSSLFISHFPK